MNMDNIGLESVRLLGRTSFHDGITYLGNTGSGFECVTSAHKITAVIVTPEKLCGSENTAAFIAVYINGSTDPFRVIRPDKPEGEYTLYEGHGEEVTLRLFKLTEAANAYVGIKSLSADGIIKPTAEKPLKIEFIGDSITCGYGNMTDRPEDGFKTYQENGFLAYAASTARQLDAECNIVATSGIGLLSSWTGSDRINDSMLMSEVYKCSNYHVDRFLGFEPVAWDFSAFAPSLVVVYLGTNDKSYIQYDYEKRLPLFHAKYADFITYVRHNNPNAYILCLLGAMTGSRENCPVYREIESVCGEMSKTDSRISSYCFAPVDGRYDGTGGSWHPTYRSHRKLTAELCAHIKTLGIEGI